MKAISGFCGVYFLVCCFSTLFVAGRPMAHAACVNEFQDDCDDDDTEQIHHVMRRSIIPPSSAQSQSLIVVFAPVVQNVTYYNTGDTISFHLNLTHNQSATVDLKKNVKVELWSQYLEPVLNSLSVVAGSITGGKASYNSSAISFEKATLGSSDVISVTFDATVKASIMPLANLYFALEVAGQDDSNNYYHYGPAPSQPTLYAVFPTVSLTRTSYSYLWVSNTTSYTMTVTMPKLNFSLFLEISTNINEFSFMEVTNVQVKSVGSNILSAGGGSIPTAVASYDSSEEAPFNDRAVLDFGNLTVSDESLNKIVIEYDVTINDHPLLANNSKHWVGAGMRSGYQMLWVGQEALYIYKSEPSLTAKFTTSNDTASNRYLIGDKLFVSWTVEHTENTSYEDAENVRISFHSNTLQILEGTYNESGNAGQPLTILSDKFHSGVINVSTLTQGQQITGDLVLIVTDKISPLETLDVFLQLKYKNIRGDEKLNTTHKPSPPYVAGVPGFSLKLNGSTNTIRIGGRAKFFFNILMRKMVSTLKVEVILPVNETSIMSLISLRVVQVGSNIQNNETLSQVKAQLNSTVGDPKLHDRGTIDFGKVESTVGDNDHPDNKIVVEFEIIVNDHANVTNGSKHWVGVGVRGGQRMMWIGDVALIADVPVFRRPILQVEATCTIPGTKLACSESSTLERSSKVYFNGTVYHEEQSQQYAENVMVFWMFPPYVKHTKLDHDPELTYQAYDQGPKFILSQRLHFLDRLKFSVEGNLDPDGLMPPGETYAVSPIQLSYSPQSISTFYGAPPLPVTLKFKSPGVGAPAETPSELPEVYSRGFLVDTLNGDILYVCQKSSERLRSSCFSTSDKAYSWTAMDQQVCYVIGQDGNDLYGIACNNRAYMRKRGTKGAWYGIEKPAWESAKAKNNKIQDNLVKIEENYARNKDPVAGKTKTIWGGNAKGVYIKDGGNWQLKAQWKCCGN